MGPDTKPSKVKPKADANLVGIDLHGGEFIHMISEGFDLTSGSRCGEELPAGTRIVDMAAYRLHPCPDCVRRETKPTP